MRCIFGSPVFLGLNAFKGEALFQFQGGETPEKSRRKRRLAARVFSVLTRRWVQQGVLFFGMSAVSVYAGTSDISSTRHNFSSSAIGTYKADGVTRVCVFCHAPHSPNAPQAPLWNRSLSTASSYVRYSSGSFDAEDISAVSGSLTGSSKLCLSCHDGVMAIGTVGVLNGMVNATITRDGGQPMGQIPVGTAGVLTGYTRNLGTDLSNDHPISFVFDDTLSTRDGELRRLSTAEPMQRDVDTGGAVIGIRAPGYKPYFPLEPTGPGGAGQVECATCHDPHKKDEGATPNKFLRLNRHQVAPPFGGAFNAENDQSCLACHDKAGNSWAQSAHANPIVADEAYVDSATKLRDYPKGSLTTPNPKVWQRACLNCHDTHTVQGSRRLLREGMGGSSGGVLVGGKYQLGSSTKPLNSVSAIENTCYQCHQGTADRILTSASGTVPDIKTEFERAIRMPIRTADQGAFSVPSPNTVEVHEITDSDFMETAENLGKNDVSKRHVECTDCHNPHRVRRRSTFYGISAASGEGAKRTHNVGGTAAHRGSDGNVASGVLRGIWGVEPAFSVMTTSWPQNPISYTVKKGDPATASIRRDAPHLTREYQLCFKCHSNYSNSDTAIGFPPLENNAGGTFSGTNAVERATNVAAEYGSVVATDPPTSGTDQGEDGNDPLFTPVGSPPATGANHRSWHPVMWPTGRTRRERTNSMTAGAFQNIREPFNTDANIGYQTMYCSDCHGSEVSWTQKGRGEPGNGPDLTKVQGPHGSNNPFLLKGIWAGNSPTPNSASNGNSSGSICGRCHDPVGTGGGFNSGAAAHSLGYKRVAYCTTCHISVPHGWKNKAFLVNLLCLGDEVPGYAPGCTSYTWAESSVTLPPYYNQARLRVGSWARSTTWEIQNCMGGSGKMLELCVGFP